MATGAGLETFVDPVCAIVMGKQVEDDWEDIPTRTVILFGKASSGKSATGNTLLKRSEFATKLSSVVTTKAFDLKSAIHADGAKALTLNVLDMPGFFGRFTPEVIAQQITESIKTVDDGIDAIILVSSLSQNIDTEEAAAFASLNESFGFNITSYFIMVYTGGDGLGGEN